jgi:hypothetical protein
MTARTRDLSAGLAFEIITTLVNGRKTFLKIMSERRDEKYDGASHPACQLSAQRSLKG